VLLALVAGVFACLATLVPEDVIGMPLTTGAYSAAVAGDRLRSAIAAVIVLAAAIGAVAAGRRRLGNGRRQSSLRAPRCDAVYHDRVVAPRAERPAMPKRPVRLNFWRLFGDFAPSIWLSRAEFAPRASVLRNRRSGVRIPTGALQEAPCTMQGFRHCGPCPVVVAVAH
jgi:hypothetical protein